MGEGTGRRKQDLGKELPYGQRGLTQYEEAECLVDRLFLGLAEGKQQLGKAYSNSILGFPPKSQKDESVPPFPRALLSASPLPPRFFLPGGPRQLLRSPVESPFQLTSNGS